jgi:pantetheine-phosphate adenylyltransferase
LTIALYPGTFDPITNGHLDIAVRASRLFEKLVIGVFNNPAEKSPLFTVEERVQMAKEAITGATNIEVLPYAELTGSFARKINAKTMVRGLRMGGDFEHEFNLGMMSKKFFPELENVCLMSSVEYQFVSSSMLKEAASLGAKIETLVPANVAMALRKKFKLNN